MPRAIWNGAVIAETERHEKVEGNVYFPPDSVNQAYLRPSETTSRCVWKGTASYYTLEVDGARNDAAAWFYPAPFAKAARIKDHVAFWRGVKVEE